MVSECFEQLPSSSANIPGRHLLLEAPLPPKPVCSPAYSRPFSHSQLVPDAQAHEHSLQCLFCP